MIGSEKSFDTGEVVLNYFEGPKSGPPLLMLHGLFARYQVYEPIFAPFMAKWHVFACDFRGHGKSGKTPGHYQITDYVRDIDAFLNGQFTEPVILIGHSLGAISQLEIAYQVPERVRALLLLDPPLFMRDQPFETSAEVAWCQFLYTVKKECSSFADIVSKVRLSQPGVDEAVIQEISTCIQQSDIDALSTLLQDKWLVGWDLHRVWSRITVPTLLLYGDWEHGGMVRNEDAIYFKAHLPQAVGIKIPDASHSFPMDQPELTVEHIQNFLQSV